MFQECSTVKQKVCYLIAAFGELLERIVQISYKKLFSINLEFPSINLSYDGNNMGCCDSGDGRVSFVDPSSGRNYGWYGTSCWAYVLF